MRGDSPRTRPAALCLPLLLLAAAARPAASQSALTEHTLRLDDGGPRAEAAVADVAWLAGRWLGEGLGATVEEVWLPPAGGAMAGVFRLVRDGAVDFYEIVTLVEDRGSLVLRLKHFGPGLVGWEEKAESVSFPLVRRDERTLWFDGFTIRRIGPDRMRIWVALKREETSREARFEYRRATRSGVSRPRHPPR